MPQGNTKQTANRPARNHPAAKKRKRKQHSKAPFVLFCLLLISIAALILVDMTKLGDKIKKLPQSFTYPTDYEEYVLRYSTEYDCDPVLVFSVIKVESGFDPNAGSDVGARGLMQLMEDAFNWREFRLDDDRGYTFDDIFDPKLNIQYGTYYLSYLMEKYNGSIELTAAAYHCGMGLVDSWIEDGTIDPDNFRVSDIPDENDQTANYVEKICDAYEHYKEILSSSHEVSE